MAGTPGLIGSAKEHPARKQLERLLPQTAAVGSGLVIDSFGGVSKQQDIVIYDRASCPVFSINDTPEATFYPCEGVIAVGEVKSTINDRELRDSVEKIASVKRLRRFAGPSDGLSGPTIAFRSYGSATALVGGKSDEFNQSIRATDQIFGFVLCAKFGLLDETIHLRLLDLLQSTATAEGVNIAVSLSDGFVNPYDQNSLCLSANGATGLSFCKEPLSAFPFLIERLGWVVSNGRTVQTSAFGRYFQENPGETQLFSVDRLQFKSIRE